MTDARESLHLFFNDSFYSYSPSILSWLNDMRNYVQTDTYTKIILVEIPRTSKDANDILEYYYIIKCVYNLCTTCINCKLPQKRENK